VDLFFLQFTYAGCSVVAVGGGLLGEFIHLAHIYQRTELNMEVYNIAEVIC